MFVSGQGDVSASANSRPQSFACLSSLGGLAPLPRLQSSRGLRHDRLPARQVNVPSFLCCVFLVPVEKQAHTHTHASVSVCLVLLAREMAYWFRLSMAWISSPKGTLMGSPQWTSGTRVAWCYWSAAERERERERAREVNEPTRGSSFI